MSISGEHLYRADPLANQSAADPVPVRVHARYEVILACGTFNTPQLLMLSGIGPNEELTKRGIKINVTLGGVGKNLQDRLEVGVVHRMHEDFAILKNTQLQTYDLDFADWLNGQGLYATNGVVLAIIKRSNLGLPDPDLFMFAVPGHFSGYRPKYSEWGRKKNYFTWVILKGHTKNAAGRVALRSKDPRDPPDINFNSFDESTRDCDEDADAVAAGIEFVRKMTGRSESLFTEIIPGRQIRTRPELAQFVKDCAWGHHACGTARSAQTMTLMPSSTAGSG